MKMFQTAEVETLSMMSDAPMSNVTQPQDKRPLTVSDTLDAAIDYALNVCEASPLVVDLDQYNVKKADEVKMLQPSLAKNKKKYNHNHGRTYFCPFGKACVIKQSHISQHIRRKHPELLCQSELMGGGTMAKLVERIKAHTIQKISMSSEKENGTAWYAFLLHLLRSCCMNFIFLVTT